MELIKIFIFGLVLCICMHSTISYVWRDEKIPDFILKFKWIIFLLIFISLFLLEDYVGLLEDNFYDNKVVLVVNFFISYTFVSSINRKK